MADVPIDRIRCRVGFVSQHKAKIKLITFNNKPIRANSSGGRTQVSKLKPLGGSGSLSHFCHVGTLTIRNLVPFRRYTYALQHEGERITGSFRTIPDDDLTPYSILTTTCDSPSAFSAPPDGWTGHMKELIRTLSPTVIANAHIDDVFYPDGFKISHKGGGSTDPETGIRQINIPMRSWTDNANPRQAENDYIIAWLAYFGMFPRWVTWLNHPNRQWLYRNIAHWDQFGDHEFYGDAHSQTDERPRIDNGGVFPELDRICGKLWERFIGDCGPPRIRDGEYYWGMKFGPMNYVAYDRITHCKPYDAADRGNSHQIADPDSDWSKTANRPTNPTLADLNLPTNQAPRDFLGEQQVTDILNHLDSDHPFKCVFSSNGISGHNQPYADWWPDEWWDILCRRREFVVNGNFATGPCHWTSHDGAIIFHSNEHLIVENASASSGEAMQKISGLSPNTEYTISVLKFNPETTIGAKLAVGSTEARQDLIAENLSGRGNGPYTFDFITPESDIWVSLRTNSAQIGDRTSWVNVSLVRKGSKEAQVDGLGTNPKLNGERGHLFFMTGDVHTASLKSFHANGVDGLGKNALDVNGANGEVQIWNFSPGTVSSLTGRLNKRLIQGGVERFQIGAEISLGDRQFSIATQLEVNADASPPNVTITFHDLLKRSVAAGPFQMTADQIDNSFS